ncbi:MULTISPECIES: heavy-metal-associated domain-containing protein [Nitrosomonas]|jgi:copper chaperone|uniref:Copper chaperone n=1 Tax=Nitrosomonas oligotropha TaxID=42354 RepID=A0A1H8QQ95_9PROT|nr:heavy-metal-associated domain-containing protein [Nitrosomonas oligotropha]MBK7493662.1 heavy-metal-associated domain-containing protein [Nitrosomonas sp.]MBP9101231.1 heavy-metal-associated domain-containing protein [Nitrosomonas sp.]MBX9636304.1 heavy-metal-associated domain-containing protein [Nitrosomonas sp.]PTQ75453.1 copper chaperone [Nitrosomonas oligotropha]TXI27442.1 MAG: copper chaperone [Nitrosomonas oligotropha]
MQTATIKIKGMTCMGCVNSIKNVLRNVPGIAQLEVTLDPAQAIIQFDPENTSLNQLKETIIDAGFDVVD